MITRTQKVRLGVFLTVSTTLLVGTLAVLGGLRLAEDRDTYTIRYQMSLSGLEAGSPVKFNGIRVGRVDSIRIDRDDPATVVVGVSLDAGTPVKKDAKAIVNLAGITGLKFIELSGGTAESAFIPPGGQIPAGESTLDRLTVRAEDIAERIQILVEQLNRLSSDENQKKILAVVDHVDGLVLSATGTIEENRPAVRDLTASLKSAGDRVDSAVRTLEVEATAAVRALRQVSERVRDEVEPTRVRSIVTNVERISAQVRVAVDKADLPTVGAQFKDLMTALQRTVRNIDTTVLRGREDLFGSLTYLLETMENLSEFSRQIRENPSLLLGGAEEKERKLP
jgi:ABC-type transporter Mla subunit MlaD